MKTSNEYVRISVSLTTNFLVCETTLFNDDKTSQIKIVNIVVFSLWFHNAFLKLSFVNT